MAKSVKIETIKAAANQCFRDSKNEYVTGRKAIQLLVADLLMQANAYRGFRYLPATELGNGMICGIAKDSDGKQTFPDDSRIAFL